MSEDNTSVVSIVAILAILLLVAVALYFFMIAGGGNDADIEVELPGASSPSTMPDSARGPDLITSGIWFST